MQFKILIVAMLFILADVITGFVKALIIGEYSSSCMREGLFHKLGELLAMMFGYMCEWAFPLAGISIDIPIVTAVCTYIIIMEVGSITENIGAINPNIADILKTTFAKFKKDE